MLGNVSNESYLFISHILSGSRMNFKMMHFFNDLRFYGVAIGFHVKISLKISKKNREIRHSLGFSNEKTYLHIRRVCRFSAKYNHNIRNYVIYCQPPPTYFTPTYAYHARPLSGF